METMSSTREACAGSVGYAVSHVCRLPLSTGTVLLCAGARTLSAVCEDALLPLLPPPPSSATYYHSNNKSDTTAIGSLWADLADHTTSSQYQQPLILDGQTAFATARSELARAVEVLCGVAETAATAAAAATNNCNESSAANVSHVLLQAGEVTCMTAQVLGSGRTALAIVGTTAGTLCAFLVDGFTLSLLREASLREWAHRASSEGGVCDVHDEAIVDVAVSNDPAGRLEFIAAATTTWAVMLDVHTLLAPHVLRTHVAQPLPDMQHRAKVDVALCVSFPDRELVRLLAPQRLHAAANLSVALLLVFADGTVRFVRRGVRGGALHWLREAMRTRLQHSSSSFHNNNNNNNCYTNSHDEEEAGRGCYGTSTRAADDGLPDMLTMPAVVYRYELSALLFPTAPPSATRVIVNDAALVESAARSCMDLLLVGLREGTGGEATRGSGQGWWALARGLVPAQYTLPDERGIDNEYEMRQVEVLHSSAAGVPACATRPAALHAMDGHGVQPHNNHNNNSSSNSGDDTVGFSAVAVMSSDHTASVSRGADGLAEGRSGGTPLLVLLAADGTLYTTTRTEGMAARNKQLPALQRVTTWSAQDNTTGVAGVQGLSELYMKGAQCVVLCASGPLLQRIAL